MGGEGEAGGAPPEKLSGAPPPGARRPATIEEYVAGTAARVKVYQLLFNGLMAGRGLSAVDAELTAGMLVQAAGDAQRLAMQSAPPLAEVLSELATATVLIATALRP